MFALEPCQGFSPRLGVLVHQATEDFTAERGAIHFIVAARRIDRARLHAGLAARAVVERERELFQEGPVVLLAEQLFETGKEALDELVLFLLCLRPRQPKRGEAIE